MYIPVRSIRVAKFQVWRLYTHNRVSSLIYSAIGINFQPLNMLQDLILFWVVSPEITLGNACLNIKLDRWCTYNVTSMRVRATVVVVGKRYVLHDLNVCL